MTTKAKKKVSRKAAPKKKRTVFGTRKRAAPKAKKAAGKKSRVGSASMHGALKLRNQINALETKRQKEVDKIKKDIISLEINKVERQLLDLMRQQKKLG